MSDVFLKVWQIRNQVSSIDNLGVYLYTIAKNFSLNYITKNYKHPVVSLDKVDLDVFISTGTPEELCISANIVDRIREAIQQLPPQCRLIFRMVKKDELFYKEVAQMLDISVFTVRNQLAIATRKLAEALPTYVFNSSAATGAELKPLK